MTGRTVVHLTTVDMSLALLLLPQLVGIRDAGYDVIGVSAPGPYVDALRDHGIRHVALRHSTRARDIRADLSSAWEFTQLCRRLRPDIVHTHNPKPGFYGRICARLAGVPAVVNTVHGLYAQPTDRAARRIVVYGLERLAAACSHAELVQNEEDLAVLQRLRVPPGRLHLLGNGVDLARFDPSRTEILGAQVRTQLGVPEDAVVVGLVGRLVREKGYREVFAAARRLAGRLPQVHFLVVGPHDVQKTDAVPQAELDRAAREPNVTFLGARTDVERLYPAMDLYVLASYREGFPRSAMEAAAMGLPIVATNVRGCRQVVDHGRSGLLVPPGDAVSLAKAIEALATDRVVRERMGNAGRMKASIEFDDRRQIDITLRVYRQLLDFDHGAREGVR